MSDHERDIKKECIDYTLELIHRFNYVYDRPIQLDRDRVFYGVHRNYWDANQYKGSIYDHRGRLIQSTLRFNNGDIVPADPEILAPHLSFKGVPELTLYGGSLFPILGHFLVETLGRLWPLLQYKGPTQLYFHHWPGLNIEDFRTNDMYTHIFNALGNDIQTIRLIDEEMKFTNMILPDTMSIYHSYMHPGMNTLYDKIVDFSYRTDSQTYSKIFLSRSRWLENRRIQNEELLDEIFDRLGYKIIYPEQMKSHELVNLLSKAEMIAATDGSHAHLVSFASPNTKFISLDTRIIPTQVALAALRGIKAFHIPFHRGAFFDVDTKTLIDIDNLEATISHLEDEDYQSATINGEKRGSHYDEVWSIYRML